MKKIFAGILIFASLTAFAPFALAKVAPKRKIVRRPPTYHQLVQRATGECEDGTLYFGRHVKSACSAHEGVMQWFR
jgi:hypothetical protein